MTIAGLAASPILFLAFAVATPALAQTSPSGGIGTLPPPPSQTPDQAQGPPAGQPAPAASPDDRGRPVQAPSSTGSQR
jgi:hypothetical protein